LAMSTQSRAENIAHTAMYTYKGGEQNISPGTFVVNSRKWRANRNSLGLRLSVLRILKAIR
jgi:hypothetical protein